MPLRVTAAFAAAFLFLAPTTSRADLSPYSQDFEGLVQSAPGALSGDGWKVFGNVFSPDHSMYYYGYGPFPAPNGGPGFCGIDIGQGGPDQGAQQLVVYSDYNNGDHQWGNLIEANVFQQQVIGAADVGHTWKFEFDAKRGNIAGSTTALAFIKTLNPAAGYAMTNFITVDMTAIPDTWGHYPLSIYIDAGLVGQILQFGFANTTTYYQGAGIFYDNLAFRPSFQIALDIDPDVINTKSSGNWVTAYVEPIGFDPTTIDIATIRLAGYVPADTKFAVLGDHDRDHVPDLMVKFNRNAVAAHLSYGENTVELTGSLTTGGIFAGSDMITLTMPPGFQLAASVSPNPFNPAGSLKFRTNSPGTVSVHVFDLNGRLVRTLLESRMLPAGEHAIAIDGRGAGGEVLPSGVYFFRLESADGVTSGRFTIMK